MILVHTVQEGKTRVFLRKSPSRKGRILRVHPFRDKPFILVKWDNGSFSSCFGAELKKCVEVCTPLQQRLVN